MLWSETLFNKFRWYAAGDFMYWGSTWKCQGKSRGITTEFLVCLLWAQNNQGTLFWSPNSFFVCLLLPQNDQGALLQRSNFLLSLLLMTSDPMNKFLIISYFAEIRIYCFWQITDQHSRMKLMNVRTWSTLYDTWPCVSISNSLPQRNFRGNLMWHMRTDIGKTQWLWSLEPGS